MTQLIIDGDVLIYQALARDQSAPLSVSQVRFGELVNELVELCFGADVKIYVGGKDNFRKHYEWYKANRKHKEPHPHLYPMRDWVVEVGLAIPAHGAEADDFVIAKANDCRKEGIPYVIASIDKDLRNFPGTHLNTMKREFINVTEEEADMNYFAQLLSGDGVDNIKGLWMIGPAKAKKYLKLFPREDWPMAVAERWQQDHPEDWQERLTGVWNAITIRTEWDEMCIMELPHEFEVRPLEEDQSS